MRQFRLFRTVVVGALLTLAPAAGVANAQSVTTATCVGGPRTLTKQENSMVNDYEILVAKANSKHTALPDLSPDVAALIACSSGGAVAPAASAPAAPAASPSSVSGSSASTATAMVTCSAAAGPLTKQQNSMVNDYEILVAKANSKHTEVPPVPPDVAALIGC